MQKITLLGNLGRDPEERTTKTGVKIVSFSLAVSPRKDQTVWYECQIWEKKITLFEGMLRCLKKGSRVLVCGDFNTPETYEGRDGSPKIRLQLEPDFIQFVGAPKEVEKEIPKSASIQEAIMGDQEIPF